MGRIRVNSKLFVVPLSATILIIVCTIFDVFQAPVNSIAGLLNLDQGDTRLWSYIKKYHISEPSTKPYNLDNSNIHPNKLSSLAIDTFNSKTDGVFIEVGAYDGEFVSNTLDLEQKGWEGILIECNPQTLPKLRAKNRKAWLVDVCLSPFTTPKILEFQTLVGFPESARLGREYTAEEMKRFNLDKLENTTWVHYEIPCFPLYSIIQAVGRFNHIDFLSLDVEGQDLAVLRNFPFDKINIELIIVEVLFYNDSEKLEMRRLMEGHGYDFIKDTFQDYAFVRKRKELQHYRKINI